ncbi:hypothetical protein O7623_11120 [Solwaraspora sp. WMMD791]|uniref:hypothetical protein n=1 Tax=Solwaraspora sp. WMMD791 TaxID=3016086 RepID=UPI00249A7175|nr:hypothetical protein [Solwaraspora sp. WMMD791]WFE29695.1 hypothetical protein O7623_11120 [Solwaraspora sp. WMMD791]
MSGDAAHRAPLWWVARWCGRALTYLALAVLALSAGTADQPYGWSPAVTPVQVSALPTPTGGGAATPHRVSANGQSVPVTRQATPVHGGPAADGAPERLLSRPTDAGATSAYAAAPAPPRAPPRHADSPRPQAG